MKTVFTYGGNNPYAPDKPTLIVMEQHEDRGKRFRVSYGVQVDDDLTYRDAAAQLGECIMHHLACEALLNTTGE